MVPHFLLSSAESGIASWLISYMLFWRNNDGKFEWDLWSSHQWLICGLWMLINHWLIYGWIVCYDVGKVVLVSKILSLCHYKMLWLMKNHVLIVSNNSRTLITTMFRTLKIPPSASELLQERRWHVSERDPQAQDIKPCSGKIFWLAAVVLGLIPRFTIHNICIRVFT